MDLRCSLTALRSCYILLTPRLDLYGGSLQPYPRFTFLTPACPRLTPSCTVPPVVPLLPYSWQCAGGNSDVMVLLEGGVRFSYQHNTHEANAGAGEGGSSSSSRSSREGNPPQAAGWKAAGTTAGEAEAAGEVPGLDVDVLPASYGINVARRYARTAAGMGRITVAGKLGACNGEVRPMIPLGRGWGSSRHASWLSASCMCLVAVRHRSCRPICPSCGHSSVYGIRRRGVFAPRSELPSGLPPCPLIANAPPA